MTVQLQVEHIGNSDIHYPKETLIPSLEFALVEYLDCDDG